MTGPTLPDLLKTSRSVRFFAYQDQRADFEHYKITLRLDGLFLIGGLKTFTVFQETSFDIFKAALLNHIKDKWPKDWPKIIQEKYLDDLQADRDE